MSTETTRTGTVTKIDYPEEESRAPVKFTITSDDGRQLKVSAFPRILKDEEWIDNAALVAEVGSYGTFTGEVVLFNKMKFFQADNFAPATSANGSTSEGLSATSATSSSPQKISSFDDGGKTMVMSYAKDIVCHLIDVGVIKEPPEAQAMWLKWSDDGITALRQSRTIPVTREES